MCGINSILAFHYAASLPHEKGLLATRDAMRARGIDGDGVWWSEDRRCALGRRRLAIIDLSKRAGQPMASADGRFVAVFNGEIDLVSCQWIDLDTDGRVGLLKQPSV